MALTFLHGRGLAVYSWTLRNFGHLHLQFLPLRPLPLPSFTLPLPHRTAFALTLPPPRVLLRCRFTIQVSTTSFTDNAPPQTVYPSTNGCSYNPHRWTRYYLLYLFRRLPHYITFTLRVYVVCLQRCVPHTPPYLPHTPFLVQPLPHFAAFAMGCCVRCCHHAYAVLLPVCCGFVWFLFLLCKRGVVRRSQQQRYRPLPRSAFLPLLPSFTPRAAATRRYASSTRATTLLAVFSPVLASYLLARARCWVACLHLRPYTYLPHCTYSPSPSTASTHHAHATCYHHTAGCTPGLRTTRNTGARW